MPNLDRAADNYYADAEDAIWGGVDQFNRCYDAELKRLLADGMAPWLAKLRAETYAESHWEDEE